MNPLGTILTCFFYVQLEQKWNNTSITVENVFIFSVSDFLRRSSDYKQTGAIPHFVSTLLVQESKYNVCLLE